MTRSCLLLLLLPLLISAQNFQTNDGQRHNEVSNDEYLRDIFDILYGAYSNIRASQPIINAVVDFALQNVLSRMNKKYHDIVEIPSIEMEVKDRGFFKPNYSFKSTGGTISGITSLKRASDVILTRNGTKLSAYCDLAITKPSINYKQYEFKYGFVKVSGEVSATIDGLSTHIRASIDYDSNHCKIIIEDFHVLSNGKTNVKLTGLGILNRFASYVTTVFSDKWDQELIKKIESTIKERAETQLLKYNCEKLKSLLEKS